MARNTSEAYDLSLFETRTPQLRAVKTEEHEKSEQKKRHNVRSRRVVGRAFLALVFVALLAMMIISRVQLTEMNDQILDRQEQLAVLKSETSRLSNERSSKTSAQSIEEYAAENGMEKVGSYQIQYITVDGGDQIEVADPASGGLIDVIASWFGG